MTAWSKFAAVTVACGLLLACASGGNRGLNYRASEITPTLEIPPDLTQQNAEENLDLPGSNVGLPENRGRYVETGNLNVEVRTLPRIEGMRIDGQGDLHWLVVPKRAERLYPLLRTFWAEQGFRLLRDEPAVGIMETEWLSLRSGSDSFLGSLLESLTAAESRDQYRTRLERALEGEASHIYLAHRGQELQIDDQKVRAVGTGRTSGWEMSPSDPAKEYEMLNRLMVFLGMQDQQVRAELEKIGLFAARARIEFDPEDEETFLIVSESFQQTWNRLLHRFDRRSIEVLSKERESNKGELEVRSGALIQTGSDADEETVLIMLKGSLTSNITRIDVLMVEGSPDADLNRVDALTDDTGQLVQNDQTLALLQELLNQLK